MNELNVNDNALPWMEMTGRVCVVTGGASGIGAEAARQLGALGAWVAVLDRHGQAAAEVAAEIARAGGRAIGLGADVSDPQAIANAAERVQEALGPCQVLVNSAALVGYAGPLLEVDLDVWNRTLAVNLTGSLVCTRAFGKQMVAAGKGGSIVNVASICGHHPLPNGGAYSVGKAGLMMLTRMLSLELSEHRIRCNSVSPGMVRTAATEPAYRDPLVAEGRARLVPSGRIADPKDLADVIVYLASDRSGYINGQDILVDGALAQTMMTLVPKPTQAMKAA
jgi:NAD(P)-dependent dehydrogenase (short-subunit alcohol dehydrogenase family)